MFNVHQFEDGQLIKAYQEGNNDALSCLIKRHKDKVYTSIYMLVKDKYLAEDLFQETFLKIVRTINAQRYNEQGKFLPWAIRVAHNLCMDHFRKVKREIPILTEKGDDIFDLLSFVGDAPKNSMEQKQIHASIRKLVEELPEDQREVIVLRVFADLSFKEIATMTGVSINTALGRMRYALINLRKMIEKHQLVLR